MGMAQYGKVTADQIREWYDNDELPAITYMRLIRSVLTKDNWKFSIPSVSKFFKEWHIPKATFHRTVKRLIDTGEWIRVEGESKRYVFRPKSLTDETKTDPEKSLTDETKSLTDETEIGFKSSDSNSPGKPHTLSNSFQTLSDQANSREREFEIANQEDIQPSSQAAKQPVVNIGSSAQMSLGEIGLNEHRNTKKRIKGSVAANEKDYQNQGLWRDDAELDEFRLRLWDKARRLGYQNPGGYVHAVIKSAKSGELSEDWDELMCSPSPDSEKNYIVLGGVRREVTPENQKELMVQSAMEEMEAS